MTSSQAFAPADVSVGSGRPRPAPKRGYVVAFGIITTLQAAIILGQAVSAGSGLAGNSGMFGLHGAGAGAVHTIALLQVIAGVLVWRPGRGPWWPAVVSLVLLLAGFAQSALGGSGAVAVHVPLGMSLFGLAVWLAVWAWMPRRVSSAGPQQP